MHTFGLFSLYPVARIHGALTPRCRVMLTALCIYHEDTCDREQSRGHSLRSLGLSEDVS